MEREDPGISAEPVFVYSTLMSGAVMEALLGRVPLMESALCFNHRRFPVVRQVFSGMVPAEVWDDHALHEGFVEPEGLEQGSLVVGQACFGLTMVERRLLDAFADEEYSLVPVTVQLAEDDRVLNAVTYMWQEKYIDGLLWRGGDWDFGVFQHSHLSEYLGLCKEFRVEFLSGRLSDQELEDLTGKKFQQGGRVLF